MTETFKSIQYSFAEDKTDIYNSTVTATASASATSTLSQEDADSIAKNIADSVSKSTVENNKNVIDQAITLINQNMNSSCSVKTTVIGSTEKLIQDRPMKFLVFDTSLIYILKSYTQLNNMISTVDGNQWIFNDLNKEDDILSTTTPIQFITLTENLDQQLNVYLRAFKVNSQIIYTTEQVVFQMPDFSLGNFEIFNYTDPLVPFFLYNTFMSDSYFKYNGLNYIPGPNTVFTNFEISNSNISDLLIRIDTDITCENMVIANSDLMEIVKINGIYYVSALQPIVYSPDDPSANIINMYLNVIDTEGNIFNRYYIIEIIEPINSFEDICQKYTNICKFGDSIINDSLTKAFKNINVSIENIIDLIISHIIEIYSSNPIFSNLQILTEYFANGSMNKYKYINSVDQGIFSYLGNVLLPQLLNLSKTAKTEEDLLEIISLLNVITENIDSLTASGSSLGIGSKYYGNGPINTSNNLYLFFHNLDLYIIPQTVSLIKILQEINDVDKLLCMQTKLIIYLNYINELSKLNNTNKKLFGITYNNIYYVNKNIDYINKNNISY